MLMSELSINKTLYYEHIINQNINIESVNTTQKRLALQDAFNCDDNLRALKALDEYLLLFKKMLKYLSHNRNKVVLKEQPQFDWTWEGESWMSTCWQWENIMIHAALYKLHTNMGILSMKKQSWKEASTHFISSARYSKTIIEKILPLWTWKIDHTNHVTFKEYWYSNLYHALSLKDLCTLQFAYTKNGISDNNAIKLLNRIENYSNNSILYWSMKKNVSLMNWARVGKAILHARVYSEKDEYGKSIGLLNNWEGSFQTLVSTDHLNIIMECFVTQLRAILDLKSEWISSNNNIYYKPIEVPELVFQKDKMDIINTIECY